jgi:hypothetical protein
MVSDTTDEMFPAETGLDALTDADGNQVYCAKDGCSEAVFWAGKGYRPKFCVTHRTVQSGGKKKKTRDRPPANVNLNFGPRSAPPKKDAQLQAVQDRAEQLATTIAAVVLLTGHPDDSADIARGVPVWSKAVRDLAEHEEWLRKLAAGGETSARAMAWLNLLIASATIALPILIRHEVLPQNIAALAGSFIGQQVPIDVEPVETTDRADAAA